ncbi:MAG: restriction endonuclease subunit S [Synechococcus sp.]|nr:restriction endonuclease subunit S [Synechococcus sp.]
MKEGWEKRKLRDVCKLINGRAYSKPELLAEGKYPVLRVGNFFTNNKWYYSDLELGPEKYCDNGDLLYAWSASFGPRIWEGGKAIFHYHIWRVQPIPALIDKKFLFLWFLWDTDEIKKDQGAGATMIHVSKGSMEDRDILLPPLPEQQRIVALLDEAFAGLATAQAHAARNLQNARDLFDSQLSSIFSKRGEGWVETTLEEAAADDCSLSYGIVQPGDDVDGGLPVVRPTDLRCDSISLEGLKRIDANRAESYQRTTLQGGELLLCVRGTTGVISKAAPELAGANVTRGIVPIRLNSRVLTQAFGFHLLRSEPVQMQIRSKTYGAALMQINIGDLRQIRVAYPPLHAQEVIVTNLDALAAETQRLAQIYEQKQAVLAALKQSLLHQAFNGEL